MKLRIVTSMLLVLFLSVWGSFSASAHNDCKGGSCCKSSWHHRAHWGHNNYYYGPDGCYSKAKSSCCEAKKKSCCAPSRCEHTYSRARYHEDCCGTGHLHVVKSHNND